MGIAKKIVVKKKKMAHSKLKPIIILILTVLCYGSIGSG